MNSQLKSFWRWQKDISNTFPQRGRLAKGGKQQQIGGLIGGFNSQTATVEVPLTVNITYRNLTNHLLLSLYLYTHKKKAFFSKRYNENQNQIRILMALLATSCCLNLSNSNPPSLPSKPTQLLPR